MDSPSRHLFRPARFERTDQSAGSRRRVLAGFAAALILAGLFLSTGVDSTALAQAPPVAAPPRAAVERVAPPIELAKPSERDRV